MGFRRSLVRIQSPRHSQGSPAQEVAVSLALCIPPVFAPCHFSLPLFPWTRRGKGGKVKVARGTAGPTPIRTQPPPRLTLSPKVSSWRKRPCLAVPNPSFTVAGGAVTSAAPAASSPKAERTVSRRRRLARPPARAPGRHRTQAGAADHRPRPLREVPGLGGTSPLAGHLRRLPGLARQVDQALRAEAGQGHPLPRSGRV